MILSIETSDRMTGVAFSESGHVHIEYSYNIPMQHASILSAAVERGLDELKRLMKTDQQIPSHLAIAIGPGSFTGLRIGLSFAQGFCFGRNIPVAAISNHTVLANHAPAKTPFVYSLIDARRQEAYLAVHHFHDGLYEIDEQQTVRVSSLTDILKSPSPIILAPGFTLPDTIKDNLQKSGYTVCALASYRASELAPIAERMIAKNKLIPARELEPMYIRTFAGVS